MRRIDDDDLERTDAHSEARHELRKKGYAVPLFPFIDEETDDYVL
jgi:hypothetical protein